MTLPVRHKEIDVKKSPQSYNVDFSVGFECM